jgi:hypothetical protein
LLRQKRKQLEAARKSMLTRDPPIGRRQGCRSILHVAVIAEGRSLLRVHCFNMDPTDEKTEIIR